MKKSSLFFSFLCVAMLCKAQNDAPPMLLGTNDKEMATKLVQFLINYPDAVWEGRLSDTVKITFDLNAAGTLSNAKLIKDIGEGCGEEVKNVVTTKLPRWTSDEYREKRSVEMHVIFDKVTATHFTSNAIKEEMKAFLEKSNGDTDKIYTIVEEAPSYGDGSRDAALRYMMMQVKYPAYAREHNIQGRVVVSFIVEKDGSLSNIKPVGLVGGGCDEEVIRILNAMERWKPGKQNGKPVRVQYTLPVSFKLGK
jgi:TonB family protein